MRECRVWPWTSLGFEPASIIQVALEVRRLRQFTKLMPSLRPTGLMNLVSTDWEDGCGIEHGDDPQAPN